MYDAEMDQFEARAIESFLGDLGVSCEAYELDACDVGDERPDRWLVEVFVSGRHCYVTSYPAALIEKLTAAHEALRTRPEPSPHTGQVA